MQMPVPYIRSEPAMPESALVRVMTKEDVMWNRPVFRAPPLVVRPLSAANFFSTESLDSVVKRAVR